MSSPGPPAMVSKPPKTDELVAAASTLQGVIAARPASVSFPGPPSSVSLFAPVDGAKGALSSSSPIRTSLPSPPSRMSLPPSSADDVVAAPSEYDVVPGAADDDVVG